MTTEAHVAGSNQSKGDKAKGADPGHDGGVGFMPLLRNHVAKTLQESVGYLVAPTRCTEYQWEKGSMLHLPGAFFPLLFQWESAKLHW